MIDSTVSQYHILEKLGEGGMGEVYLAEDTKLKRQASLKFLPEDLTRDEERKQRFIQEARAAAAIQHPHIAAIYDIDEYDGRTYIAMEYIPGDSLRDVINSKKLSLRRLLELGFQIAEGLAKAHDKGVVHRDIKPENVLVSEDGYAKIIDFGLAKLIEPMVQPEDTEEAATQLKTRQGLVVGTVAYMSPEQARGEAVDARSDVFSFGALLYEMVSGESPFRRGSAVESMNAVIKETPPPVTLPDRETPADLQRILRKALAKEPSERYQSIKDLALDLKELWEDIGSASRSTVRTEMEPLAGDSEEARNLEGPRSSVAHPSSSDSQVAMSLLRRHKLAATGVLLAVVAAIGAGIWFGGKLGGPALAQEDELLVADFINTTGDDDFDGALKAALTVKLEESPFLNVVPESAVQETLAFMERSPETRITQNLAREICQRRNVKAMMQGEISGLGNRYLVTLNAENCQTGASLAREQAEAESKEDVLEALDAAVAGIRRELGESLASIDATDTPLSQATTSSLEALRAYSNSQRANSLQKYAEAVAFSLRAIELDPNFASAHYQASINYGNLWEGEAARRYAESAFELRERASERERFNIEENYHWSVTRDIDKAIETLEIAVQLYPRLYWNNLCVDSFTVGRPEKALKACQEANRIGDESLLSLTNTAFTYRILGKVAEGKAILSDALAGGLESWRLHRELYLLSFLEGDREGMAQQAAWFEENPDAVGMLSVRRREAAYYGRLKASGQILDDLVVALRQDGRNEAATLNLAEHGLDMAALGDLELAKGYVRRATELSLGFDVRADVALVLATAGEHAGAEHIIEELETQYPEATLLKGLYAPTTRAILALKRGELETALEVLRPTQRYELCPWGGQWSIYTRGLTLLALERGEEAAAEFERILLNRGADPFSVLQPLSHLGLARAKSLSGDAAAARKHYQDLLALWKDAESDIPVLKEAKAEYEALSRSVSP